jgi:hypothetical protein
MEIKRMLNFEGGAFSLLPSPTSCRRPSRPLQAATEPRMVPLMYAFSSQES